MEEIENSKTPIKDLVNLYIKFHDEAEKNRTLDDEARIVFSNLEYSKQHPERIKTKDKLMETWKKLVKISMKEFNLYTNVLELNLIQKMARVFMKIKCKR